MGRRARLLRGGPECERRGEGCQVRARWLVRGKVKGFDEWGQIVPKAPWGPVHPLCSTCLEPVKAELELAELLELDVQPIDPHDHGLSTIVLPPGVGGVG
jgi:hypothetical protein